MTNTNRTYILRLSIPLLALIITAAILVTRIISSPEAIIQAAPQAKQETIPVKDGLTNMIANPSFEDPAASPWYAPWVFRNDLSATITQDTSTAANQGKASIRIYLPRSDSSQPWIDGAVQFDQPVASGQAYTLTFWAKASTNRPIRAILQEEDTPFTEYIRYSALLSTQWKQYTYTFTAPLTTTTTMLNFNLADEAGSVWLDDVSLCRAEVNCAISQAGNQVK